MPGFVLYGGMPILNAIGSSLLSVGTFGLITAVNYAHSSLVDWTIAALFIGGAAKQSFVVRTGIAGLSDVLNKPSTTTSARSKLNEAYRHGEDGENCSMRAFKGQIDDREYVAGLKKDLTSVASVATAGQALPLKCSDTIRSPRATIHQMILTQTPKALYNWQTCGE